jgi:hypothetical protein
MSFPLFFIVTRLTRVALIQPTYFSNHSRGCTRLYPEGVSVIVMGTVSPDLYQFFGIDASIVRLFPFLKPNTSPHISEGRTLFSSILRSQFLKLILRIPINMIPRQLCNNVNLRQRNPSCEGTSTLLMMVSKVPRIRTRAYPVRVYRVRAS